MRFIACRLCQSTDSVVVYPSSDDESMLSPGHIAARQGEITKTYAHNWVRCKACGLLYANPIPEPERLAALYSDSRQEEYGREMDHLTRTYGHYMRMYLGALGRRGLAVDVGAGNGFFLRELLSVGFAEAVGFEPSRSACQSALPDVRDCLRNQTFSADFVARGSVDLLTCFQTLEHFYDVGAAVADFDQVLAPGGLIYVVAHDISSLGARFLGARHPIVNAGHLVLFDKRTLRTLFARHFEVLSVFDISNTFTLGYLASLLPVGTAVGRLLHRGLAGVGMAGVPLTMRFGNIGLVARKR